MLLVSGGSCVGSDSVMILDWKSWTRYRGDCWHRANHPYQPTTFLSLFTTCVMWCIGTWVLVRVSRWWWGETPPMIMVGSHLDMSMFGDMIHGPMLELVISFLTWLSRLDVWTRGMQLGWANGEDTLDVKEHLGYAASWPLIKILLDQMIREDCLRFMIILSNSGQLKFWISRHKSITWMVSDFLYNHNITFWWFKFSI